MKKTFFILFSISMFACPQPQKTQTVEATPAPVGCGKDTDCKGERVCVRSVCQNPSPKDTEPRQGKWLTLGETTEDTEDTNSPSGPGVPGQKGTPAASNNPARALEEAVLTKINEHRASQKIPPLSIDPLLQKAAQKHSEEMFKLGYFGHQSPTAGMLNFSDRIKAAGAFGFSTGGENIIYREDSSDDASLASALFKQWLNSPPHKENMLSRDYSMTGLGFYRDGAKVWGTQVFVDRLK